MEAVEQVGRERPGDRRALQSVSVQFFANGVVYASFIPELPEIRDRVGISIGGLGLVLTLASISGLIGSLLTGRVIARFGTRNVVIAGTLLSIGSLPVVGFATTPAVLVVGLVGLLFFDVFIDVAMNVQGSELSARRRTPVMNRLHGLWSLGTVSGGIVTVLVNRADVSVQVHLAVVAVALLAASMFVVPGLLRVDEPHHPLSIESGPAEPIAAVPMGEGLHGTEVMATEEVERAIRRRRFGPAAVVLGLGGATAMMLEVGNGDWAAFRLSVDFDSSAGVASAAFLLMTIGMTVGRLGGDWVQVRIGSMALRRLGVAVAGVGSILATLIPIEGVSLLGFLVAGLGTSVLFPQLYDQAARLPGPPGSGFAAMLIGQRSTGIVVPLVIGSLANTELFGVGQAMAVVLIPAAIVGLAITYVRLPPSPPSILTAMD
ncbi:MAG: MFS transporter [Ilumatobacteraceae bacterium]